MLTKYFSQEFFKDRALSVLTGSIIVSTLFGAIWVILKVGFFEQKIPVGYTQYGVSPYELGEWYVLYEFAIFIVLSSAFAIFASLRLFKLNRTLSLSILTMQHIILIFFFLVSTAILNTSPVTS